MFMYQSDNVKDAISQFHEPNKLGSQSEFGLYSFQCKLKRAKLIIEQLLKEENDNFFAIEAKYNKLSMELYNNDTTDYIENCEQYISSQSNKIEVSYNEYPIWATLKRIRHDTTYNNYHIMLVLYTGFF